jgi:hypothetical protein
LFGKLEFLLYPLPVYYSCFLQRLTLLVLVLIALAASPSKAQLTRYYSSHVVSSSNTTNPTAATGYNPTGQAILSPPLLLGVAALRLGFPSMNPAGSKAGLVVNTGGSLTLAALSSMVINTYLAPSTTPQETIQMSQLLTLQVANGGLAAAEFMAAKPFDQLELAAGGLANAYSVGLVTAYADRVTPLPVELVSFQGQATSAGVQLSWQTASELHNAYFAIERASERDATTFTELGRVAGGATTTHGHHYQFTDERTGPIVYYRLRQVDTDGKVHYSPVVVVQLQATAAAGVAIYPNPAVATLMVASPTETHFSLLNHQGQLLRQLTLATGQQRLDISYLLPGVYYLRETATGRSMRFVKVVGQ